MLRGSISKAMDYSYGPYSQLLNAFEETLRISDLVVVAGFGWSDQAIASRLFRYAFVQNGNLLAIDGDSPLAISKGPGFSEKRIAPPGEQSLDYQPFAIIPEHMSHLGAGMLSDALAKLLK